MSFVGSAITENNRKCPVCCLPLREATRTTSGHWTCGECTMRVTLRENDPVERSPIANEPETEVGAVGGEARDHATHPINVREQLLEEQTTEQLGFRDHVNGAPEYPNGLMELTVARISQSEVQDPLYCQHPEDWLIEQLVGRRLHRQASGGANVTAGCPNPLLDLVLELLSAGPTNEIPLCQQWLADRQTRQHSGQWSCGPGLLYCNDRSREHPRRASRSIDDDDDDDETLAQEKYRGSHLEIVVERYPIQEKDNSGPVEHNCTCSVAQQYPINRSSPPEPPLTEGCLCKGTYIWRILDFSRLHQDATDLKITSLESPPIYTQLQGYKFCMRIYPNGINEVTGRCLALYVRLMTGEFDDTLRWPFTGRISLSLLDVSPRDAAYRNHISGTFLAKPTLASFQKPSAADVVNMYGYQEFAPIQVVCSPQFINVNGTVMIKIEIRG